jgi:hypothetical protein
MIAAVRSALPHAPSSSMRSPLEATYNSWKSTFREAWNDSGNGWLSFSPTGCGPPARTRCVQTRIDIGADQHPKICEGSSKWKCGQVRLLINVPRTIEGHGALSRIDPSRGAARETGLLPPAITLAVSTTSTKRPYATVLPHSQCLLWLSYNDKRQFLQPYFLDAVPKLLKKCMPPAARPRHKV